MQIPVYSRYQFINQDVLNTAQALLYGNWSTHSNYFNQPGVANGSSITIGTTGLVVGLTCASPVGVQFSSGVFAQGLGTTNGASSNFYSINLAGSVPASGSQTVYLVAYSATISGAQNLIVGPPPGHPDYDPTFSPALAYTQQYDSFGVSATLFVPNNTTFPELARVTLTAGQASIPASSVITAYQQAAASYVPEITYPVLMTSTQGGTAAINSPALTWQSWTGSTSAQMQMFLSSGTYLGGPSAPSLIFQTPGASAAFINFNSQSANISLWAPGTGVAANSPAIGLNAWTGSAHVGQLLFTDQAATLYAALNGGANLLLLSSVGALTLPSTGVTSAVSGNLLVGGTLTSNGAATFNSLNVVNGTILSGTLNVSGVTTLASTLNVSGSTNIVGQAVVDTNVVLSTSLIQLNNPANSAVPAIKCMATGAGGAPALILDTANTPSSTNPEMLFKLNSPTQLAAFWYTISNSFNAWSSSYNSGAPTLSSFKNTLDDGTGALSITGLGTFNAALFAKKTTDVADTNSAASFMRADSTYAMTLYPQIGGGSNNDIVQTNDSALIVSGSGIGTGVLTLSVWSATKAGLRLTANGTVTTANNTLDDGSGNVSIAGTINASKSIVVGTNAGGAQWVVDNGAAGAYRGFAAQTAGVYRWFLGADASSESGSNAGSNFQIVGYSDAGGSLGTWLGIVRATGALTSKNNTLDDGSGNATFTGTVISTNVNTANLLQLGAIGSGTVGNPYLYINKPINSQVVLGLWDGSGNLGTLSIRTSTIQLAGIVTSAYNTLDDGAGNTTLIGTLAVGNNTAGAPTVSINGAAATYRKLLLETAGVARWTLFASNSAESGSNAGSDLEINAYSDAGSYLSTPLLITRATGALRSRFNTLDDGSGNVTIAGQATVDTNVVLNTTTITLTNSATSAFPNITCKATGSSSAPSFILGTVSSPSTANPDLYSRLTAATTLGCFWYNGSASYNYLSSLYNSGSPTLSSFKNTLDDGAGNLTAAGVVKGAALFGTTTFQGVPNGGRFTANNQTKSTAANVVTYIGNSGGWTGCTEDLGAPGAAGDTITYINSGGWSNGFTFSGNGHNLWVKGASVGTISSATYANNNGLQFTWDSANSLWVLYVL